MQLSEGWRSRVSSNGTPQQTAEEQRIYLTWEHEQDVERLERLIEGRTGEAR